MEAIKEEVNLDFNHFRKEVLLVKIEERMSMIGLTSLRQYLIHILNNKEEINKFIDNFRIHHPLFFNDDSLFKELEKQISLRFQNNRGERFHVWIYPGCFGEEAYTFAIFLKNMKKKYNDFFEFKIVASNFNPQAQEIAIRGIYEGSTLVNAPADYKSQYFRQIKKGNNSSNIFIINENIKKKVVFLCEGILCGHSKSLKYNLIVCRNFISVLNNDAKHKLLKLFASHSIEGTILVLGAGESLEGLTSNFEPVGTTSQLYEYSKIVKEHKFSNSFVLENKKPRKKRIPELKKSSSRSRSNMHEDRVVIPQKDILLIKSSQYAIIHSNQSPSKMGAFGLGSCIALILRDKKNDVHGMSHILLPDSQTSKNEEHLLTPHKYVDTSIKELRKELIKHGAHKKNIKAIVVGGAHIINVDHEIQNADVVIEELKKYEIPVEKIDIGGKRGRSVIYDAKDGSILVKNGKTNEFRKL
ncbi:MAG: hypothetical protein JW891_15745 [Candidatus Lokiarchaeota archaeon]|nr:hypothetical protein [Candidatus Lokiarchaeota archaeon]